MRTRSATRRGDRTRRIARDRRTAGRPLALGLALALSVLAGGSPAAADDALAPGGRGDAADYLRRVKPLLRSRCYACHGSLKQKAGLRLDTAELILRGGDDGPVVVRGAVEESVLIDRVSSDDPIDRMPPEHEGEPLTEEQIATLRDWIAAGAPAPEGEAPEDDPRDHWAFRPIARPEVPRVAAAGWVRNPIDAFVAAQHERAGLKPRGEASRTELLRRLSFDLTGLPPTAEEIAAFQRDDAPDWYERTAERLLDDPHHGERWARHWMDIWRYSDWWGLGDQLRNSQKHIWHWRDWIIESLNADTPYDEMVRLMLAADELRPEDPAALRATGYLARNYVLFNRNQWMDETVEHVSKAFLGLTMNCAKCHDHKYDPIAQGDYYRMRAIFEPYHVRLDMVPDEADLARDGIPRVFDGVLDVPTYRFLRGDEARPDRSAVVEPGVPSVLAFEPLRVEPVELPLSAWQPERHDWVLNAHRAKALRAVAAAEAKVGPARAKCKAAECGSEPAAAEDAKLELQVAERGLAAAQAELHSVEQRAAAMRAGWDPGGSESEAAAETRRAAARAERELAAARSRVALAEALLKRHRAKAGQEEALDKEVAAAREAEAKAVQAVEGPGDQYTRLPGAQWTPTRFLNSTKDDPEISFPPRSTGRRRALALWITDRRNPLTARVAVNHIWARHIGTPLVPSVFEFGRNGSPPTHPELLDWLASELIDSGWSMKHLHRLIVESATYRMSSSAAGAAEALAKDPDNVHLWRRPAIRLESQAVRDAILVLAGTLDPHMGGPPVPAPAQADSRRRSLYFFHSNNERNLFLTTFDEALVKECYRREQSIVPQQALALTNSRLVLDSARPIADRLTRRLEVAGGAGDDPAFARLAFVVLLGVEPGEGEVAAMVRALAAWKDLPDAGAGDEAAASARANLVWTLLNHNDFVTLR